MKSIQQLSDKLAAQWFLAKNREQRFRIDFKWPLRLSIGKPSAKSLTQELLKVQKHLSQWRQLDRGKTEWQSFKYQSVSQAIDIPLYWLIRSLDEWVAATDNRQIKSEYKAIQDILKNIDPIFHSYLIRNRRLWSCISNKDMSQQPSKQMVIRSCQLAMLLEPGLAQGRPLRAVSIEGYDTKFLEMHQRLLTQLLNIRFSGALDEQSLEKFLDAAESGGHWLLVKPLCQKLLPFELLRIRASELATTKLPCKKLIVVENEKCAHQLPDRVDTIAILGAGLNLSWLKNINFKSMRIIYWGDLDTWGLKMLSMAKNYCPHLQAILMDRETYKRHQKLAVAEPTNAGVELPQGLNKEEKKLYKTLLESDRGRLEQEKLAIEWVHKNLLKVFDS